MNPITGVPNEGRITARDYESFRALLNGRRQELHLTMLELDEIARLPSGYASKLLSEPRRKRNYHHTIGGQSMDKLLSALGVEIALVPARAGSSEIQSYPQLLRERRRKGGLARFAKLTKKQRAEFSRKGGIASAAKRRGDSNG